MKKLITALACLIAGSANAANNLPGGSNGQFQYKNGTSFAGATSAQITAAINNFTNTLSGTVPASGGGASNFLRADGTWTSPGGTSPAGSATNFQTNNGAGGLTGLSNPAALTQITSKLLVDPRNYGATCSGQTWLYGRPVHNDSSDDTLGFEMAEYVATSFGGAVLVPDGCWVQNLLMLTGTTMVGETWTPNYGYDYGFGGISRTLILTPGSGYTNGTYPLNSTTNPGSGTGFETGSNAGLYNYAMTSSTSLPIQTGSATFTATSAYGVGFSVGQYITISSTSNSANFMFGAVTAISGSSVTFNVTTIGGSGTFASWNVYLPSTITVSGGSLASATVTNIGNSYGPNTVINIPTAAGAGTGGAINAIIRQQGQPWNGPVLYAIGTPTFVINWNGAENIAFVGFEINANSNGSASGTTYCEGGNQGNQGFGGKVWNYQMSMKGCYYGIHAGTCYDYLVSDNSDYGANNYGVGGCYSDFLSDGDTFASDSNSAISGSGAGFARVSNARIEYNGCGICGSAFLELSIVNTQFDHQKTCNIQSTGGQNITMTGGAMKAGGTAGSFKVLGAANNGSGLIRLTVTSDYPSVGGSVTGGVVTGDHMNVTGVTGTTEANGTGWVITVVDTTHLDLQGSTFTNAYVSGGYAGVWGKDADICLQGTSAGANIGFTFSNVGLYDATSVGGTAAPAYVLDMTTSGANNDYIGFFGGQATAFGTSGIANNYNSFSVGFASFDVSPPAHYVQQMMGLPYINTMDPNFSVDFFGNVGLGAPSAQAGLDDNHGTFLIRGGATPTVGTCGTTPLVTGANSNFTVTVGSGTVNSCSVNFGASSNNFSSAPANCFVQAKNSAASAINPYISALSSSAVTLSSGTNLAGAMYGVSCY